MCVYIYLYIISIQYIPGSSKSGQNAGAVKKEISVRNFGTREFIYELFSLFFSGIYDMETFEREKNEFIYEFIRAIPGEMTMTSLFRKGTYYLLLLFVQVYNK